MALPVGAAFVEFIRLGVFNHEALLLQGDSRRLPARYLAFVLHAGKPDDVEMIDLGEADAIDQMVAEFRGSVTGEAEKPCSGVPAVGVDLGNTLEATGWIREGSRLREAVFDKLIPALAGCTRLFLAPDGDLTRLPFEVLPTADGRCLIQDYAVSYLSCGRDLLRSRPRARGHPVSLWWSATLIST